ncbi:hydro-lyase, Fe-S type, tartrate/fumarate subfamily, beta subunit [Methanohalobium evestigatum Z-7303]|uniref:Hydro-lyase, Fe-S type, tartrate/fumarate subfamily, beta subunit n=1 Tax=Methanohalobium evestigatum (strain ATCC BAA-1072 / DSM 3721 / NBRC 107634 / OCM 161 / Z-7303) TaxID=644295 RepID=D7EAZ4_METEZ|nr:FumA C-terminus/TtdB family hydratase beta subunit [Methanohalobium evestigatum]ADI74511.1 hydro-lyase, Fe-S type, tartrate/fumarate subfamily, beta subunit [Methanohalobium evestigatum Z-7303]
MVHYLYTPIDKQDIMKLNTGDIVYLTGTVLTARDEAHKRILEIAEKGKNLPFELNGSVVYHCGPLMKKDNGGWDVVAAGPTTSSRMSGMTPELLEKFNVRALVGKGGMQNVSDSMKNRCVYLAYTGGCAALAVESIKKVSNVYWLDLGMPEAVWELEIKNFGPLIVGIDAKGNDLYSEITERAKKMFLNI